MSFQESYIVLNSPWWPQHHHQPRFTRRPNGEVLSNYWLYCNVYLSEMCLPNMEKRFFIVESCSSSAKMSSQRLFIKPDINLVVSKCGTHFLFWDKCFRTFIQVNKSNCWYKFIVTNLCGSGQNRVKRFNCWMCANIKHVWSEMWEAC